MSAAATTSQAPGEKTVENVFAAAFFLPAGADYGTVFEPVLFDCFPSLRNVLLRQQPTASSDDASTAFHADLRRRMVAADVGRWV